MREIACVQQGFFPTQDRIVQIISKLFRFPATRCGAFVVLDAGCGTGKAIHDLRVGWLNSQKLLRDSITKRTTSRKGWRF
ncbi:MAG TPA: hypothetical protein VKX17_12000 [Planctomycetota bacterium]|nr:hypothetical protein [Planctomycetota bacterium]